MIGLNVITGTSIGDQLSSLRYSFEDTNRDEIQKVIEEGFDFELSFEANPRFDEEFYCLERARWVYIYDHKFDDLKSVTFSYLFDLGLKRPIVDGKTLSCPFIGDNGSYDHGSITDSDMCLEYLSDIYVKIENARLNKKELRF